MSEIVIRGQRFPDARAAADRFGVQVATVKKARRDGNLDKIGRSPGPVPMRVHVRGMRFVSARAAADHFGVQQITITQWIGAEARGVVLPPVRWRANSVPVQAGGFSFPSKHRAERLLGLPKGTFSRKPSADRDAAILAAVMRYADAGGGGV